MATILSTKQDDNLEIYALIWLDGLVNQLSENLDCQRKLRTSINYLKTFENSNQCEQYIQSLSQNDRIILIVSGRLGQQILPSIHHLQQVIAIYVYCMDKQVNEQWTKNFIKVKSIFTRIDDLVQQVRSDQRKREHHQIELPFAINFYNPNITDAQSITGPNSHFIHSQLITDYLLEMQWNEINKSKFIFLCKETYKNNDTELRIIQEFEHTYSSARSISWYTRNCFLKRIVTKAFQVQNISLLLHCLFFIRDIQQQLELNKSSSIKHVYRCQLISTDELEIFKKSMGQFVSINTFLSAYSDRQQMLLILQDYNISNKMVKVLFEIDTNPQFHGRKPFADITSYSEKEILFMVGSIFRIENLSFDKSGIIIISLIKYSKPFLDHLKIEFTNNKNTLLSFGHMLGRLDRFDDAEKCYYYLIQNFPDKYQDVSKCYHALGNIACDRDDYDMSLEWHQKSLDIKKNTLTQFDSSFAYSYNSIGAVYYQRGDYDRALEFYRQALDIWQTQLGGDNFFVAMCYKNIGLAYKEMKKYPEALDCYQRVLIICQKLLPNDEKEIGDTCKSIGVIYQSLGQFDLALEYYNNSLMILEKSRHSNKAMVLNRIGNIYEDKTQLQEALLNYQQAMRIYREILPDSHNDIVQTEEYIQRVITKLKK